MQIHFEVPEDIAVNFGPDEKSIERAVLEGLALEGARSGRLSRGQVRRLLGFETRYEVDGFLKDHGIVVEDSMEQVERASDLIIGDRR